MRIFPVRETAGTIPLGPRTCGDHGSPISGETWYQAFTHDRYGNMATPTDPNVNVHPLTVRNLSDYNAANNRLTTLTGIWNYDTAGFRGQCTQPRFYTPRISGTVHSTSILYA